MATRHDLIIDQGATFKLAVEPLDALGERLNLDACTARAQIRRDYRDPMVMAELSCLIISDVIDITLSAESSAALIAPSGVWDLELVASTGEVIRLLEGGVDIRPEVTR